MLVTVNVALPLLVMVIVAVAVAPVVTLPNARFPLTPMTFVPAIVPWGYCAIVMSATPAFACWRTQLRTSRSVR